MTHTTRDRADALPWDGQPYSVKRHGVTITNCDSEPVHTPGCIQSHGVLVVTDCRELKIRQVSTNCETLLGRASQDLLGADLAILIGDENLAIARDLIEKRVCERNPRLVFHHSVAARPNQLEVTLHTVGDLALFEFDSTVPRDDLPDCFESLRHAVQQLHRATSTADFCKSLSLEVLRLTGLDRVMVYRFHEDGHGEVVAEASRSGRQRWLGLHYPAGDIPQPAREIFKKTWIRPVRDIDDELVEMEPLINPVSGAALEMTHCNLRGPSVMYTEYLRNMGVRASLTMPIRVGDELWGLIAGHHDIPLDFLHYDLRWTCELLAQVASVLFAKCLQRENVLYQLQLESTHNTLIAQAAQEGGLAALVDGPVTLADALVVGGAAIYHRERWWCTGQTPSEKQLDALAKWLETRPELKSPIRPVYATDRLPEHYPPATEFKDIAAGIMAMGLSSKHRNLLLWFRPETIQTIKWAGNPNDKPTQVGPHGPRLTPRHSFELFEESVRGRSMPWMPVELDAASRLRMMIIDLVVSRAEQLAELNEDLARSNEDLDAFAYVASHDLKEPLRGIHKYTHQLLEDAQVADEDQRRRLEGLLRLTQRMDMLLDSLLNFSRIGRVPLSCENVDLNEIILESMEIISSRLNANQKEITIPRPLPLHMCDRAQCRRIFVNLLSNALKYNDQTDKRVEIGYFTADQEGRPEGPPGADKQTIFYVQDNGIGIHKRHHLQIFSMFKRLHGRSEYGGGAGAGLTIVKKLIQRHGGEIWLASTPGLGTTFYFTLPGTMVVE